jgi:hypothetical protein
MVPANVPPAVASAIDPNRLSPEAPIASGRMLAIVVRVTSTIIPERSDAAARTSSVVRGVPRRDGRMVGR